MALVLTAAMLLTIASVSYFLVSGFHSNTINRNFSSVFEAANGGVEYVSGIVYAQLKGTTPENVGAVTLSTGVSSMNDIIASCTPGTATISAKTPDGKFTIVSELECLGSKPIPGMGGALRFPPPAGVTGGGASTLATKYLHYSVKANAKEAVNPQHIGQTEAIYQALQ